MPNFPTVAITKNVDAQSAMVAQAAAAGLSLNGLDPISEIAAVVANLLAGAYSAQFQVGCGRECADHEHSGLLADHYARSDGSEHVSRADIHNDRVGDYR